MLLLSPGFPFTQSLNRFFSGVDSVGTVSASLVTYAAIQALQPDLIINAGTAGGFKVDLVPMILFNNFCFSVCRMWNCFNTFPFCLIADSVYPAVILIPGHSPRYFI